MSLIHLTATKIGPAHSTRRTPRVFTINEADINTVQSHVAEGGSIVKSKIGGKGATLEIWAAESPAQIEVLKDPAATNVLAQDKELGISAVGTTQGAGVSLVKYFNEVDTIAAASAEAATLDDALAKDVVVVLNNDAAGDELKLFPASGDNFAGSAADAVLAVPAGTKVHLYCETAGEWIVATQ